MPRYPLTVLSFVSLLPLIAGCGGGGGGGGGGSGGTGTVTVRTASQEQVSGVVTAEVTQSSQKIADVNTSLGTYALADVEGAYKTISITVPTNPSATSSTGTINGSTKTLDDFEYSAPTGTEYATFVSFSADGSYNNVVVGSATQSSVVSAIPANTVLTYSGDSKIITSISDGKSSTTANDSGVSTLDGKAQITVNITGVGATATVAMSEFTGSCSGACGQDGISENEAVTTSPLSIKITDATVTNSGITGGTVSLTDKDSFDWVDYDNLGLNDLVHGGQFFGTTTKNNSTVPAEVGGNFIVNGTSNNSIQGGYLGVVK